MKYLTVLTMVGVAFSAPTLVWSQAWADDDCPADQMLEKVGAADPLLGLHHQSIAHFQKVGWKQRYRSYFEPKTARDGTVFPALLEEGKNGPVPSLQVIEMLSHVDFSLVGISVNLPKMYLEHFGVHVSDSLSIFLHNVYVAGRGLARTSEIPPTVQQIYDAINSAGGN